MMQERMKMLPKLSYVLLAHNRERFIRSAVENAFAQDYEGELEYIISDDCSTDGTYDIIQEAVAAYRGGRRVVVTQTPQNMHLAGHTNHAVQFVRSDWIVRADDDDLSSVDRCSVVGRAILEHPRATAVATGVADFRTEDEAAVRLRCGVRADFAAGRYEYADVLKGSWLLPSFQSTRFSYKVWSMRVFREFGELHRQGYYIDDLTCFFRSLMLGECVMVPDAVTVYARDDGSNMSRGELGGERGYAAIVKYERFLEKYNGLTVEPLSLELKAYRRYMEERVPAEHHAQVERVLRELEGEIGQRAVNADWWKFSILERVRLSRQGGHRRLFDYLRCLPLPLFSRAMALYRACFKR